MEEAATTLLATAEVRRTAAAGVVLAKNAPQPGLPHALAKRRGIAGETRTLLRLCRPRDPTIALLEASGVEGASLDEARVASRLAQHA